MKKSNKNNTKGKIINAAWKLFYEQGYEDTTIEDIIDESQTSKGSFYHYFEGKDALLSSLSFLFDEKYEQLMQSDKKPENSFELLLFLNKEMFALIENCIDIDLLTRLFSTQLITKGERHLLDHSRVYYKLLRKIVTQGQEKGEISKLMNPNEIVKLYALCEHGLMYDWCLAKGEYSLLEYATKTMPMFLSGLRVEE